MAFGDLTYPYRYGQPNSSVVDYNPTPADFVTDWQGRYDAQANTPARDYNSVVVPYWAGGRPTSGWGSNQPGFFKSPLDKLIDSYSKNTGVTDPADLQRVRDYAVAAFKNPNGDPLSAQGMTLTPEQEAAIGGITNNREFASSLFGFDTGTFPGADKGPNFDTTAFGPGATFQSDTRGQTFDDYMRNGDQSSQFWGQANDKHAMDAPTNEKNLMVPKLEAATRAEQGYGLLTGNGQTDGLISADYSTPGFGTINGDFGQANLGSNSVGATRPLLPTGAVPNTIWGAAPQRARPWSL